MKTRFDYEIGVIKNVHEHAVDSEGKDSFRFIKAGANLSIIKNKFQEVAIFFNNEMNIQSFIDWITQGPFKLDLLFLEGFRGLSHPSILCIQNPDNIQAQLTPDVKIISGCITTKKDSLKCYNQIPIINIDKDFDDFIKIFNIL